MTQTATHFHRVASDPSEQEPEPDDIASETDFGQAFPPSWYQPFLMPTQTQLPAEQQTQTRESAQPMATPSSSSGHWLGHEMPTSTGNNFPARFDITRASRASLPVRHNIGTPSSSPARPTRTSSKQSESIRGSSQAPTRQTGSHNRSRSPHERAGISTGDDTATEQAYNAIEIEMFLDPRADLVYQEKMPGHCHVYQVSLSKRSRAEVSLKNLSHDELKGFHDAMEDEAQQWINHEVLDICTRKGIPRDRVLRMRWVLTWKPSDSGGRKPKARLVIMGFEDPDALAGKLVTAAPTLSKLGRALVLQIVASLGWHIRCGDVSAAFLRTEEGEQDRNLIS